jgi:alkanesulfonate monooxygenase SsuD/methylene tetrahydromethanopterin reductase-like flavin-dependent oxidoreductase (luciferase family)
VRYFPGITVIVAATDEEAQAKFEECQRYASPEGALALFCGWLGIDIAAIPPGQKLKDLHTDAIQGLLSYFAEIDAEREWTVQEIGEYMSLGSVMPKVVGSPQTVADELERWMDESGCDGFNLVPVTQPLGFAEFGEFVVPELQRRGRMPLRYEGDTLRERYFGVGQARLPAAHVARTVMPDWPRD